MKRLILLAAIASACFAQVPTISNLAVYDIDHASGRVYFTTDSAGQYVEVLYGATSGTYPCNSPISTSGHIIGSNAASFVIQTNPTCQFAPGATVYYLPVAWPSNNNTAQICQVGGCGSGEHTFVLGSAVTHPVQPATATVYAPSYPDTSDYAVIDLVQNGSGYCVASANVAAPTGYGWGSGVTAGDSIQTIVNEIGYKAMIRFPQGGTCKIDTSFAPADGIEVFAKSPFPGTSGIDDPSHPWIIFTTKQVNVTDFPPFGVRTNPAYDSKLCTLVYESLTMTWNMKIDYGSPHHIWWANLKIARDPSVHGTWSYMFMLGPIGGTTLPAYLVVDRLHLDSTSLDHDAQGYTYLNASSVSVVNNYMEGNDAAGGFRAAIFSPTNAAGPYNIDNNYVSYVSMGLYNEELGGQTRMPQWSITRNFFTQPLTALHPEFDPLPGVTWDGITRYVRQPIETKGGPSFTFVGNTVQNYWAFQNNAPAIILSCSNEGNTSSNTSGTRDSLVAYNIIRHGASGFGCGGLRPWDNVGPPDAAIGKRARFHNNLVYDIGRHKYSNVGSPSLLSGLVDDAPGCEDYSVDHNTFSQIDWASSAGGSASGIEFIPSVLAIGGGTAFNEGFYFTDNVLFLNLNSTRSSAVGIYIQDEQGTTRVPSVAGASPAESFASMGGGIWGRNVIIAGNSSADGASFSDLSSSDVTSISSVMPSGDLWMPGNTIAARQSASGLSSNYTFTPTVANPAAAGANINAIIAANGIVTNISTSVAAASAAITYIAPDARVCSVDTSADGTTWARVTDSGGVRSRSLAITGLTASTAYQYRLMCYYDQTAAMEFPVGQITTGTFTTLSSATRDLSCAFLLSSFTGATSHKVTLTAADGSTHYTATCSSSPCVVASVPVGDYTAVRKWLAGATVLAASDIGIVSIR